MKTDIEKMKDLLTEFGVKWEHPQSYEHSARRLLPDTSIIHLEDKRDLRDTKVEGYDGFYTNFVFDTEGKFVKVEIYE